MRSFVAFSITLVAAACGSNASSSGDDDPAIDAGTTVDAGGDVDSAGTADAPVTPVTPVTCGATTCGLGETCEQGTCKAPPCVGATVPGDYATIEAAATALAATGNDATICLGTQTYDIGSTSLEDDGNHDKVLRIVGAGMDRSLITGRFNAYGGWGKVRFEGVQITNASGTAIHAQELEVEVVRSRLVAGIALSAYQVTNLLVDSSELVASSHAIYLYYVQPAGTMTARVENSYLHGEGEGVYANTANGAEIDLLVSGCTFQALYRGVHFGTNITATVASSIFTGNELGMEWPADSTVTKSHNALWGNTTNYAGVASDGEGYIKTDCMLVTGSPAPRLLGSSPCANAGSTTFTTAHDFYGVTRGSPPDIGAVEVP